MAGYYTTITLRDVLCQKKPALALVKKSARNSYRESWPELSDIRLWNEFDLHHLNQSYGHVLSTPFTGNLQTPQLAELENLRITSDQDVRDLIRWHDGMMRETLDLGRRELGLFPDCGLRFQHTASDGSSVARLLIANSPRVDHVIELDSPTRPALVVGIARASFKWKCARLLSDLQSATPLNGRVDSTLPLRQLANICKIARTRYGYIQTDEDLVACCFSYGEVGEGQTETTQRPLRAAVMPIPWTRHGVDKLTTQLALWWLSMLAMATDNVADRDITTENNMANIGGTQAIYASHSNPLPSNPVEHLYPVVPPTDLGFHLAVDDSFLGIDQETAGAPVEWTSPSEFLNLSPASGVDVDAGNGFADDLLARGSGSLK